MSERAHRLLRVPQALMNKVDKVVEVEVFRVVRSYGESWSAAEKIAA